MSTPGSSDVTQLIQRLADGETEVSNAIFPLVYERLRGLADNMLRQERGDHTLQPTALVHEAYLKLAGGNPLSVQGQAHFAAIAARAMRQVLVDHARRKKAEKRGDGRERVTLQGVIADDHKLNVDVDALDQALTTLSTVNERAATVIELSFFADMTATQIAAVVGVTERTVGKDLTIGKAWLLRELDRTAPEK